MTDDNNSFIARDIETPVKNYVSKLNLTQLHFPATVALCICVMSFEWKLKCDKT